MVELNKIYCCDCIDLMKNIDDFQKLWLDDVSFIKWREKSKCLSCKNNISCMALEEIKK